MYPSKKTVTYSQGVALYMGAVLGSGILILPGYTAELAGPASILSWVILALLSVPIAFCFARLSLQYKHYGGLATIVEHAFGRTWSAIVGWFFFVWVSTGQAVVGLTGSGYLVHAFGLPEYAYHGLAFVFLVAALVTNMLGMKASGRVSLLLSGAVLTILIATILFSFPHIRTEQFTPFAPHGWSGIGAACVLIFWACFGWESLTHLVPEFRDPERDVMRSMWTSLIIVGAVYVLLSIVTVGTGAYGANGQGAPLAWLMGHALGVNAAVATAVVACIVCLGTLNVFLASSSRLGYSMAVENKFPRWFGKTNAAGTPLRSLWFMFLTNSLTLGISFRFDISVDKIILIPTTLGIFVYVISTLACTRLLWGDRVGRMSGILASVFCLLIVPFAAGHVLVPVLVALACVGYLYVRRRERPSGGPGTAP